MSLIKYIDRIERIDWLIKLKATGTPKVFSKKLNISESILYETIALMKEYGAPIYYNKFLQSYCYEDECTFEFTFKQDKNL